MSQTVMTLLIVVLLVPLWLRARRDFVGALCYGVVVLISCTHLLKIPTPGALPELSIHRLVIISLLISWLRQPGDRPRLGSVPLAKQIRWWIIVISLSLIGSIDLVVGVKRYLDYVLEFFLLYFILVTSMRSHSDAMRVLRAACIGLTIVALLAFAEKYSGVNVVDRFIAQYDVEGSALSDIRATYRHRILLGAGMAMGWPVAFYFTQSARTGTGRKLAWFSVIAMLSACYFARSRGPWLAAGLASGGLFFFSSGAARRRLAGITVLAAVLVMLRPGVLATVTGLAEQTLDTESFKGGTYQYRWELWRVAFNAITQSPWRTLFGFGPGSGSTQSLDWSLSFRDGKDFVVESWDNDFAYILYQYGFIGLVATVALYATLAWRLLVQAKRRSGLDRDLFACLAMTALVLFFMMSNVMIFARQLYYLLWTITAVGFVAQAELAKREVVEREEETMPEGGVAHGGAA